MKYKQRFFLVIMVLISFTSQAVAQGIDFFEGTYEEALAEASERNVPVFIDFYADWCGPCKLMEKNVYPDSTLGVYYNQHFVSIMLNTEHEQNKALVEQHKISSMPTLMFVDANGEVLSRISGSMNAAELLKLGQTVTGDVKGFEELYDEYKADKKNLDKMEALLNAAPSFVTAQEGMDKKKWIIRIEKIFDEYTEQKMALGDEFINKSDYRLVNRFHQPTDFDDEIIDFMVDNMDKYLENVGEAAAYYIIRYNNTLAEELARKGDQGYDDAVDRVKGEMASAYAVVDGHKMSQYDILKANCDALYALYEEKDLDKYVELKNKYFEGEGDAVSPMAKAAAAQEIYVSGISDVPDSISLQAKEWIISSISRDGIALMQRLNIITLLGDVNKDLGDITAAKQAYNQAYAESLQMEQERSQKYVQFMIKRKLELLKLE